jgi:transcriptional regulator with XRE-family HTH domain
VQNVTDRAFLIKLGQRIRQLRKDRNLSQLDVGVGMDNFAEQVSRIERGKINVTICSLKKMAETLNITLSELFDFAE